MHCAVKLLNMVALRFRRWMIDADFATITPVVATEMQNLHEAHRDAFFQEASKRYTDQPQTVAMAPSCLDLAGVSGLIVVHLTHATDNFSIKCGFCTAQEMMHLSPVQRVSYIARDQ
jgi:hypothetical protein